MRSISIPNSKLVINKLYKMVNNFSDYGSGGSSDSSLFGSQEKWPAFMQGLEDPKIRKASSFKDLVTGKCTLDDVMQEFRMNGSDSPYNPDSDTVWGRRSSDLPHRADLGGLGPSSAYLRQKSWPAPERTPLPPLRPLRRPYSEWIPSPTADEFKPVTSMSPPALQSVQPQQEMITEEQIRVLKSLPNAVLYSILKELEQSREENAKKILPEKQQSSDAQECRFCKNNGERESYYRSHALRTRGRVACPVLRAFTCARCGASGDHAHTIKYCPLSTSEERMKSAAMMRSVRLASGRRRSVVDREPHLVLFGETTPSVINDGNDYSNKYAAPLDPLWAALEQKLML